MSATRSYELVIDGQRTPGSDGQLIEVIDPATEDVIGHVAEATPKDAVRAVEAARRAFDEGPWPWTKPKERAAVLRRMAELLEARATELRDLVVAETGSTGPMTDFVQAGGSIGLFRSNADLIEHGLQWIEAGAPIGGPTGVGGNALIREPVGVVAAITPFNFPFFLNVIKVVPAIAVGCTVVLKPHPWTPLDAFLIAEIAQEAGLPPGVLNVITGHAEVGDELSSNPMVDMVAFTGSTVTGRRIMASAAGTIKRLQLELGGKSAQVILGDVPEEYVRSVGFGAVLTHCGQGCALPTRLLVPNHLLDAYKEGVLAAASTVKIGDPRDPATTLGPLIREQQRLRVESYVASGVEQGAELVTGGKRPATPAKGFFYEPTSLIGRNSMRIAQEEIFGPVLTVIPYGGGDDEAVHIANDSIYGLAGSVVAANVARAFNVARRIRCGSVSAVGIGATPSSPHSPGEGQGPGWGESPPTGIAQTGAFGGVKQSGLGREWGRPGLEEYTEIKSLSWT